MGQCSAKANQILPFLWLGDCDYADNYELLLKHNVSAVIDLAGESYTRYPQKITYYKIKIHDKPSENIKRFFYQTNRIIDHHRKKGGCIYVHCLMGVSRSSTLVIAYLMARYNITRDEAFRYVKSKRPCIKPNKGFWLQLKQYELFLRRRRCLK